MINTSSVAHRVFSRFDINDLEVEHGYTQRIAYGNAKLENILFTKRWDIDNAWPGRRSRQG